MTPLMKEVAEQPGYLLKLATCYREQGRSCLDQWAGLARARRRVVFAGMGTSEFAAISVLGALARLGLDAETRDAGEWLHDPRTCPPLAVLISQSGESVETRLLAQRLRAKTQLVAITNNASSTLARAAGLVLPLVAGAETAISTKTYVNTLAVLYLMARRLQSVRALSDGLDRLERAAAAMARVDRPAVERAAVLLARAGAIHVVARGAAVAAARQTALTLIEGARVAASAYTGGAFRHGPFELADQRLHGIVFIPQGPTRQLLAALAADLLAKGGRVVVIADAALDLKGPSLVTIRIPACGEGLFPIVAAASHARLLIALAAARGMEAGRFRHGSKITVRE